MNPLSAKTPVLALSGRVRDVGREGPPLLTIDGGGGGGGDGCWTLSTWEFINRLADPSDRRQMILPSCKSSGSLGHRLPSLTRVQFCRRQDIPFLQGN